jgi:hypothetical protein
MGERVVLAEYSRPSGYARIWWSVLRLSVVVGMQAAQYRGETTCLRPDDSAPCPGWHEVLCTLLSARHANLLAEALSMGARSGRCTRRPPYWA